MLYTGNNIDDLTFYWALFQWSSMTDLSWGYSAVNGVVIQWHVKILWSLRKKCQADIGIDIDTDDIDILPPR